MEHLQCAAALLSPLVNLGPNWQAGLPLVHSPLESYTKDDLWQDTAEKWKQGPLVERYRYALLVDVTEYRCQTPKMSTVGSWTLSGKNGKPAA